MNDQRHAQYLLPSISSSDTCSRAVACHRSVAMVQCLGRATDLRVVRLKGGTPRYPRTLSEWRARFLDRLADVRYLDARNGPSACGCTTFSYCEAAFAERYIGVVQVTV